MPASRSRTSRLPTAAASGWDGSATGRTRMPSRPCAGAGRNPSPGRWPFERSSEGVRLVQRPIDELRDLRVGEAAVVAGSAALPPSAEIELTLTRSDGPVGLRLFNEAGEEVTIGADHVAFRGLHRQAALECRTGLPRRLSRPARGTGAMERRQAFLARHLRSFCDGSLRCRRRNGPDGTRLSHAPVRSRGASSVRQDGWRHRTALGAPEVDAVERQPWRM